MSDFGRKWSGLELAEEGRDGIGLIKLGWDGKECNVAG